MNETNTTVLSKAPLQFLLAMSRPYTGWAIVATSFSIIAQTLSTSVAYVFKGVVDSATNFSNGTEQFTTLLLWVIAYPVVIAVAELMWRSSGFCGMQWVTGLKKTAYASMFEYLSRHSHAFFSKRFAGSLGSSINNATGGLGTLVESFLWNYLPTLIAAIVTVIFATFTNIYLGLVFLAWLSVIVPVNIIYAKRIARYSEASASNRSKLGSAGRRARGNRQ